MMTMKARFPRWWTVASLLAFLAVITLRLPCVTPVLMESAYGTTSCCKEMRDGGKGPCCDEASPAPKGAEHGQVALALLPVGVVTVETSPWVLSFVAEESPGLSPSGENGLRLHSPRAPPSGLVQS
jgi:hypothetical protein